jgi:hypothetical protein
MTTYDDKKLIPMLVDLIDSFGALRRKRDAFIFAMGVDRDGARIMSLAMAAGEEIATRKLVRGAPGIPGMDAAKIDIERFRGDAVMAALNAASDLGLNFRMPAAFNCRTADGRRPQAPPSPGPPSRRPALAQGARGVTLPSSAAH